ncbi:MAG: hypothetical protein ACYC75_00760 [Minisyncoccota bacterium]
MDQNKSDLTLEESAKQVLQTLPQPIRHYLGQGKYVIVAKNLMAKYGLRVDQGGVLEREIMLLLMGIENPTEFTQALASEARLNQQVIDGIVLDVNNQIFIPLQKEMREGAGNTQQSPKSAVPQTVTARQSTVATASTYAPPPQSPRYARPDDDLISHRSAQSPAFQRVAPPSLGATKSAVRAAMSAHSKPMPNEKLLEDHEEPHIEFDETPPSIPRLVTPPPPPPPNLPGAMPPVPPPPPSPRPTPSTRSYASDPYREPIDEKE